MVDFSLSHNSLFLSVQFVCSRKEDVFRAAYWLDISRKTVRVASSRSYAGLISSIATGISSPSGRPEQSRRSIAIDYKLENEPINQLG